MFVAFLRLLASILFLAVMWLAVPSAAGITVLAPPSLASDAARIRNISLPQLAETLGRAGLDLPPYINVELIAEGDPRARTTPPWIVGLASGRHDIVIFPERVLAYPYDSIESVMRHEIAHLALSARADGRPLPRWFHEGVAVSVDAGWDMASRFQLLFAMLQDPAITDVARLFDAGTQPDAALAYRLSAALIADLRRHHGAGSPGAIAARVAGGLAFDRAFESQTGETPNEAATRAWKAYRRWTGWVSVLSSASTPWAVILALAFVAYIARARQRARRRRQWDEEAPPHS